MGANRVGDVQRVGGSVADCRIGGGMDLLGEQLPFVCDGARSRALIREAKWFERTEFPSKTLPCAVMATMSAKAVSYNVWRSLVLAQGLTIVGTMVVSFLGCHYIMPILMCGIPWASFGGSMAALT